jgi:regulator of ribonuclease activity A
MKIATTDICDKFSEEINVALPIGLKDFGGKKSFSWRNCNREML